MENSIDKVYDNAVRSLENVRSTDEFEKLKNKFLGNTGYIKEFIGKISSLPPAEKPAYGKTVNDLKKALKILFDQREKTINQEEIQAEKNIRKIDPTAPFDINHKVTPKRLNSSGTLHPLFVELDKIINIMEKLGYVVEDHRLIDDDYHVFEGLNIPKGHPARDLWDTLWTDDGFLATTHTSSMQIRVLEKYKYRLKMNEPIAVIIPGRCFRNEETDATHEHTFYQMEMIYVSQKATIGDLIGTMKILLEQYFRKENIAIRLQPSHFPFVEPGLQFMNECVFCNGTGCNICKYTGWIEIMGCGYIHPRVLENAGIDSKKYMGYAYGPGIERIVMLKNAIEDIRTFRSGDLRFLKQF